MLEDADGVTAERNKQTHGVEVLRGLHPDLSQQRLFIGTLRFQYLEDAVLALCVGLLVQAETGLGRPQCIVLGEVFLGVVVDGLQGVRDLAERRDDGLLVAGQRCLVAVDGRLAFSLERAAIEDRPGDARSEAPERCAAVARSGLRQ